MNANWDLVKSINDVGFFDEGTVEEGASKNLAACRHLLKGMDRQLAAIENYNIQSKVSYRPVIYTYDKKEYKQLGKQLSCLSHMLNRANHYYEQVADDIAAAAKKEVTS